MFKYSLVIPTYNHLEDCLRPCIESILKNTNMNETEIVIVANGCTDGTKDYLRSIRSNSVRYIWFNDSLGYTRATNIGIQQCDGEFVVLLNNDTVVLDWQNKGDWLRMLELPFSDDRMGITGPSRLYFSPAEKYTGPRDGRSDGEWFVVFFCAMIKRALFDKIGLLDEVFSPGFGEDVDFCFRAKKNGYKVRQIPNDAEWKYATEFPIFHRPESTFLDDIHRDKAKSWFERGIEIVTDRWSRGEYDNERLE